LVLLLVLLVLWVLWVLHLPHMLQPRLSPLGPRPAVLDTVPPILDGVVAAVSAQLPRNLGPFWPHLGDERLDLVALLLADGSLVEAGLEVLVESLPALLGRS
jgi:hypothetical protein